MTLLYEKFVDLEQQFFIDSEEEKIDEEADGKISNLLDKMEEYLRTHLPDRFKEEVISYEQKRLLDEYNRAKNYKDRNTDELRSVEAECSQAVRDLQQAKKVHDDLALKVSRCRERLSDHWKKLHELEAKIFKTEED